MCCHELCGQPESGRPAGRECNAQPERPLFDHKLTAPRLSGWHGGSAHPSYPRCSTVRTHSTSPQTAMQRKPKSSAPARASALCPTADLRALVDTVKQVGGVRTTASRRRGRRLSTPKPDIGRLGFVAEKQTLALSSEHPSKSIVSARDVRSEKTPDSGCGRTVQSPRRLLSTEEPPADDLC
jgi:hypothetical protein